jgi:BirA family biotin operon repressor/biotin-[acetyl-CoA-carboxylase] ligase
MASTPPVPWTHPTRFARLHHVTTCPSTQDLALADTGAPSSIYWADHQTRGRGRQGHVWYDEAAQDLAVTFRLADTRLPQPARLPVVIPCAVLRAAEVTCGRRLQFKWPNDLMAGGRKLAGILIDSTTATSDPTAQVYAIGIGLNVNRTTFPDELADSATSLALLSGRTFDRTELLGALAREVDEALTALGTGRVEAWATLFRERLGVIGSTVTLGLGGRQFVGRVADIDLDHVTLADGQRLALAALQTLRHL